MRDRDDARAEYRRLAACRTHAPTDARRRSRRGHNRDRGWQSPVRGCPAGRPFPCRRRSPENRHARARTAELKPRSRADAQVDGLDRARRYRRATAATRPTAGLAARASQQCRRPGGRNCRSETSPPAARAEACAWRHRMNFQMPSSRNSYRLPPPLPSCASRRFRDRTTPGETADRFPRHAAEAEGEQFDRIKMYPFAQGVAHLQKANDPVSEGLNDRYLKPKPEIPDRGGERPAFVEQRLVACGQ